jgi:DNA-binding transcriptional ArsR family regulator
MVEYAINLNSIFASLADSTRRDILRRVAGQELTVSEIAQPYDLTLAAVSKHLKILEKAKLIIKRRQGKHQYVQLAPQAFADATEYLEWYGRLRETQMDSLEAYLKEEN